MTYLIIVLVLYAAFATWRWWRWHRAWLRACGIGADLITTHYMRAESRTRLCRRLIVACKYERFRRKRAEWGNRTWKVKYDGAVNQARNWKARCDALKAENAKLKTVLGFTATHADCLARMQLEGRE